ncbi:pre-peptidase C-terminal domain-containing protein [Massilia sp. TWP1-3-3]|uniref:pre-peptidase C-terminal domain-containing protein n=1 Tax=Massilia sp. TWP1-3-3 TaxID=2804573 RepID=UPI003CF175DC
MKNRLFKSAAWMLASILAAPLAWGACLSGEAEPNNADTSANAGMCSGVAVSGSIASSSDYDWYKLDVAAPGAINISLAHDSGIDLDWYLYKSSGSYVAYRSTSANPETGSYSATTAGVYYVRVKSYSGAGRYTLNVTFPSSGTPGGGGTPTACTLPAAVNLGKTGNSTPKPSTTAGGAVLMGGGMDVDNAIKWMIGKSGGGDFVVLRSTGTNAYNDYIYGLGGVNSVQTLLITSTAQANDACVVQTIKNAGAVFMAGGNQADYVNYFKGQGVGTALNYLINTKFAPVGGTSAGMAIMGQYYHPGGAEVTTALLNPTTVAIGNNFLAYSPLANVVTEPHFIERLRQPRLSAFMASSIYNFSVPWQSMRGISADEATALAVDTNGLSKAFGTGKVNFVRATGAAETLSPGAALTWLVAQKALQVTEIPATLSGTNTFNLGTWTDTGGVTHYWYINNGSLTIN